MKITFLGTGEAFDPNRATTSYLIRTIAGQGSIMVDCGYDAPKSLMRYLKKRGENLADEPNSLLFTHLHGDHFGGLPALLVPMCEEINGIVGKDKKGLQRKLEIASPHPNLPDKIEEIMEQQYKGIFSLFKKQGPNLLIRQINPEGDTIQGVNIKAAQSCHSYPNYAYRFESPITGNSFVISGDGSLTTQTKDLFNGVDLLIHEGFNIIKPIRENHSSIKQIIDYAVSAKIPRVAIVHINRQERTKNISIADICYFAKDKGINLFLPEDHDYLLV